MRHHHLIRVTCVVVFVACGPTSTTLDVTFGDSERNGGSPSGGATGGSIGNGGNADKPATDPNIEPTPPDNTDAGATPLADAAPVDGPPKGQKLDANPKLDAFPKLDAAFPAEITVAAVEDTYVQGSGHNVSTNMFVDNDNRNFGTELSLHVKYRDVDGQWFYWRESMVKFPLQAVSAIKKALLMVNATTSAASVVAKVEARGLTSQWQETAVTWSTRPKPEAVIATASIPSEQPAQLVFDVTAYVLAKKTMGFTTVAFSFTQEQATAGNNDPLIRLSSREAGDAGPKLVITQR